MRDGIPPKVPSATVGCEWRWIDEIDSPRADAAMNMAVDTVLMDRYTAGNGTPSVRVYRWSSPAVTVGRLQEMDQARRTYPGAVCVRRPTGGKAVLHGDDLTISVIACDARLRSAEYGGGALASYRLIVSAIEEALSGYGIRTTMGSDRAPQKNDGADCFALATRSDLRNAVTGAKILGSAQLRRGGVVLQQMSLRPVAGIDLFSRDFIAALRNEFERTLCVGSWRPESAITAEEELLASRLIDANADGK